MEAMAQVFLDRPIAVAEWEALGEEYDGGRYEVLDGVVVVSPSGDADHSRFGEDLADMLRAALRLADLDLPVTVDIEWRTVAADIVTQAPRGDVVIGRSLDPDKLVHDALPLLVVEIWSRRTSPNDRIQKRAYWASLGLDHYWEILLGDSPSDAAIEIWDLQAAGSFPTMRAAGYQTLALTSPVAISITPADIHGWTDRALQRGESETKRADRLAERLRQLGHDDN